MRRAIIALLSLASAIGVCAFEPLTNAEVWLTNAPALPMEITQASVSTNLFETLRAEAIAGRLRITWESTTAFDDARVVASADVPGHWPARDWRRFAMKRHGTNWQVELPVDSIDVPLIYFAIASNKTEHVASPMRMAPPGALGLEQPTRIFWPFIEGFEQGTEGWRVLPSGTLQTIDESKHGRAALRVSIPDGKYSVSILTTRLRGWFLQEHRATGIELWMKTRRGDGLAAFELMANAFSTNQVLARRRDSVNLSSKWTKVKLPFSSFPKFPLADLDVVAIELTGGPGTEFLLDDVQLLGRWRTDF